MLPKEQKTAMLKAANRQTKKLLANDKELPRHVPDVWQPRFCLKTDLQKILPGKSTADKQIYASEAFAWKMYGKKRPQEHTPMESQPSYRLKLFMDALLPGWEPMFKSKWSTTELLQLSENIADAAFLKAVHIYKSMLTTSFPEGVFQWYPKDWLASYGERKERNREEQADPSKPDRKRTRLFSQTGGDAEFPAESATPTAKRSRVAGCQPAAAVVPPSKPAGGRQANKRSTGSVAAIAVCQPAAPVLTPSSVKGSRPVASGRQPARVVAAGCQPDPSLVAQALARSPTPIIPTRGKAASSSSSTAVLPDASGTSTEMLELESKWTVDKGTNGHVQL